MKTENVKYIPQQYLNSLSDKEVSAAEKCFNDLTKQTITADQFAHMVIASSVYSSQIEGNSLDINSFFRAKANTPKNKEVIEVDDLVLAYQFAENNVLTDVNLKQAHKILSAYFKNIITNQKGKYRQTRVGIHSDMGLFYLAIEPEKIEQEMKKLFADIDKLLSSKISFAETIYYAAFIHFLFAKIHPFADGNGRSARLLEKWFLVQKLGSMAWAIPTEKYYWNNRSLYYNNLNIGVNYYETIERIANASAFLQMLPDSFCYTI